MTVISFRNTSPERSEFSSFSLTIPLSFLLFLRRHIHNPKPRPNSPTTTPAIAIPAKTPDDSPPAPWLHPAPLDGVEVAVLLLVTVIIDVGDCCAVVVLTGMVVETEEVAAASPTLGGPFVDPSRAVTASRYCCSVVPVRPVIVKR